MSNNESASSSSSLALTSAPSSAPAKTADPLLHSTRLINVKFNEGTTQDVEEGLLYHCGFYRTMYTDLGMADMTTEQIGEVPLEMTPAVFQKITEWIVLHKEIIEVEIQEEKLTRERIWYNLTDDERKFFEIKYDELEEIIKAANFLNYQPLYVYSCQELARLIKKAGTADKIRELLGFENDLTKEEIEEIERQNVWCKY